ncbi:hypothetical protein ACWFRC_25515 [Bacillus cereus]
MSNDKYKGMTYKQIKEEKKKEERELNANGKMSTQQGCTVWILILLFGGFVVWLFAGGGSSSSYDSNKDANNPHMNDKKRQQINEMYNSKDEIESRVK